MNLSVDVPSDSELARPSRAHTVGQHVLVLLHGALFFFMIHQFQLEGVGFLLMGGLTLVGFAIHSMLPMRWRMPFFAAGSVGTLIATLGQRLLVFTEPGLLRCGVIIAIGMGLIGICSLPVSKRTRTLLIVVACGILATFRALDPGQVFVTAAWPIIGSMFMIRLVVYLYQVNHAKERPKLSESIAYFFMVPNVCFPVFPVVDFQTFVTTHYNQKDHIGIYNKGLQWMYRGGLQLVLYRLVYSYWVLPESEVQDLGTLIQWLTWPFLLYLRLSGQFHIAVGVLHLFGFNLPETHRLYFLATSFTDLWRRINIYWKDFMMKVFYYPTYFAVRKMGETRALSISVATVFLVTWFFHGYLWFWIQGSFLLHSNDVLFWIILGSLVLQNSLREAKQGRKRSLKPVSRGVKDNFISATRSLGVFTFLSVLWSFWTAGSIGEWVAVVSRGLSNASVFDGFAWVQIAIIVVAIGGAGYLLSAGVLERLQTRMTSPLPLAGVTALLICSVWQVDQLPARANTLITNLANPGLNRRDFAKMERGYYEELTDLQRVNPELALIMQEKVPNQLDHHELTALGVVVRQHAIPLSSLRPNMLAWRNKVQVQTNRWGMRDRDYTLARPERTIRLGLVGASFVFGAGVEDEQTIDTHLETFLNERHPLADELKFEVMNFGVPAATALCRAVRIEGEVTRFDLDALLYVEHAMAPKMLVKGMAVALAHKSALPHPELVALAKKAGVDIGNDEDTHAINQQLVSIGPEALAVAYRMIIESCSKTKTPPCWVYLPRPEKWVKGLPEPEVTIAREAGFDIIDLSGCYGDHPLHKLWLSEVDHHPNSAGTLLIAERFYEVLIQPGGLLDPKNLVARPVTQMDPQPQLTNLAL